VKINVRSIARMKIIAKRRIALLHDDITIKTFIKILLYNARDNGNLEGIKQHKFTEKQYKFTKRSGIVSKCLEYYLAHMNTYYI